MTQFTRRQITKASLTGLAFANLPTVAFAKPALQLKRGVNAWPWFSLTNEFPTPRRDYPYPPYQDQRPQPTPADIAKLRQIGLDFIRIPIDPGPFLAATPDIKAKLFSGLHAAIKLVLEHDLNAVIDLHPNTANHYWNPANMVSSISAPEFSAYLGLVQELAASLNRYDLNRVAFEPLNEPPQSCGAQDWDAVQQRLLAAARKAAPHLTLIASGACGSGIDGLERLDTAPLLKFAPLIYTFHFYEPFVFSHQGATWTGDDIQPNLSGVSWPASAGRFETSLDATRRKLATSTLSASLRAKTMKRLEHALREYYDAKPDIAYIDHFFERVKIWADRNRLPSENIMLGEFGALKIDGMFSESAIASRARYLADVRKTVEKYGFSWCLWSLFDSFGLLGDATHAVDTPMSEALGLKSFK